MRDREKEALIAQLLKSAKKNGFSYRYMSSSDEAERLRQVIALRMKRDTEFDWSGYTTGRKKNYLNNKCAVYLTNDKSKLPIELRRSEPNMKRIEQAVGYAVDILCDKQYMGIAALPKLRSYDLVREYLEEQCRKKLKRKVHIVIEQDRYTKGYHALIKKG